MGFAKSLSADELARKCDTSQFGFETTAELPLPSGVIGQPRAVAALEFGLDIHCQGFHLFALGQPGSGRTTLIREYIEQRAAKQETPNDLCFVFNFADQRRPVPVLLPAGKASEFKKDIETLVAELASAIPKAFEAPEYEVRRDTIVSEVDEARKKIFEEMESLVAGAGFQLMKGPGGLVLVPAPEGKVLPEEAFNQLAKEDRAKIARARDKLQKQIEETLSTAREAERTARERLRELDTQIATFAVNHLVGDVKARYKGLDGALCFLSALETDVVEHADEFRGPKDKEEEQPQNPLLAAVQSAKEKPSRRYAVNVTVDHSKTKGAPVIVETNPTYHNLTGRIEHQAVLGEVHTDHTMIKPGALHRANGGYLLIPARECLMNPYAWEALKRSLKSSELDVEELGPQVSVISTVTLDPEPVPLNVKVVLIGSPSLYYLLSAHDEDFQKLFKVKAEFASRMKRTEEAEREYALFVNAIVTENKLRPFDKGAVARIIEYGSRSAADQDWLTTRFGDIADLVSEAAHYAGKNGNGSVLADDVATAEKARRFRQNLAEEHIQMVMAEGTILMETTGEAIGRLNGLTVISMGDYAFGHPARITAAVAPGKSGVVSIEREVDLSGPIHGKGVLILNGFLLRKYGETGQLSLSASLVFEQTYSVVDGDSASLAELCVLLSALSGIPLRQEIAVTGSVNQHGQVQPVGGVTEKVEGYFDLCNATGLTGAQGVMLPAANRRNLTLRDDVIEAVRRGRFHIYTAETVDEALELLTARKRGKGRSAEIHTLASEALTRYTEMLRSGVKNNSPKSSQRRKPAARKRKGS